MSASRFEAVQRVPEGWIVLSPVIEAQDGQEYRHHVPINGRGRYSMRARKEAEHLASQLNGEGDPRWYVILDEDGEIVAGGTREEMGAWWPDDAEEGYTLHGVFIGPPVQPEEEEGG